MELKVGQRSYYERTFTLEDVSAFAEISGDRGIHHMRPDAEGRIMVQGLLTATLPTKLGGDLNFIAAELNLRFIRPVYVGDTIRCESRIASLERSPGRLKVAIDIACYNQDGTEVLLGTTLGVIRA